MTKATILRGLDEVRGSVGRRLGTSDWLEVTPEQVARFAAATGTGTDGASSPLGPGEEDDDEATVPPWLLLALTNLFLPQIVVVRDVSAGVNYGTGEVRFPTPVPVGVRVRARAEVADASDVTGGVQTTIRITVEAEGEVRPALVVDSLSRWLA